MPAIFKVKVKIERGTLYYTLYWLKTYNQTKKKEINL